MKTRLLLTLLMTLPLILQANYTLASSYRTPSKIDHMPKNIIADMKNIPQDPAYYATQMRAMSHTKQMQLDKEYNQKFFKPWSLGKIDVEQSEMEWPFRAVTKGDIYNSSKQLIGSATYTKWITNANFAALDSVKHRAITTKHCNVHALPTSENFYRNPQKTGEGFPFDYNQNSSYHINTPLYLSHYSLDGKWAFVRCAATYGWVHISSIALVDDAFIKRFKNNNYAVVIKDNLKLNSENRSLSIVKIGSIFPISNFTTLGKEKKKLQVQGYLFATRDANGRAVLQRATLSSSGIVAKKPLAFTPQNVTMIARQLYDEPYGWGGLLETRDCSSTTKDYFSVFGIFLRRNSSKQAEDGCYVNIKGLDKDKKKKAIITKAEPFRSMLFVPGHIVLYLGEHKGEPVIMHTYWGTRLLDGSKHILARTVITTTEPGKELANIKENSKLANTLKAIVTVGE